MSNEHTWGIKLSDSCKEHKFQVEAREGNGALMHHSLILKMVVLGPKCKEEEVNVVEYATTGFGENKLENVLCCLQGTTEKDFDQCLVDITFTENVTLKLTQGSGPIALSGQLISEYVIQHPDSEEDMLSDELDGDEEELEKKSDANAEAKPAKKRKLLKNKKGEPESTGESDDENAKPKKKAVQQASKPNSRKSK